MSATLRRWFPVARKHRFALAAAALIAVPAAADWRTLLPRTDAPIRPNFYVTANDGSLWSFSDDGVRRTDAAGATTTLLRTADDSRIDSPHYADAIPLDDGAMLVRGAGCALRYIDPQGRATWQRAAVGAERCAGVGAGSTIWLNDRSALQRISSDGTVAQTVRVGSESQREALGTFAVTRDGGVVVASRLAGAPQRLTGFDRDGRQRWTFTRAQFDVDVIRAALDGGVFVAARDSSQSATSHLVLQVGATGTVGWTQSLGGSDGTLTLAEADSGDVHVVRFRANEYGYETTGVTRVGAGGRRWSAPLACTRNGYTTRLFVRDRNDGFAVLCARTGGNTALHRWDSGGASAGVLGLPLQYPTALTPRPDGNLLALGSKTGTTDGTRNTVIIEPGNRIVESAMNRVMAPAATQLLAQHLDADGSSYVATAAYAGAGAEITRYTVTKMGANGAHIWSRQLEGRLLTERRLNLISAGGGLVCLADHLQFVPHETAHLVCLGSADGTERWRRPLSGGQPRALRVLGDGRVVLVRYSNEPIVRFAADGTAQATTTDAGTNIVAATIDAAGRATLDGRTQYRFDGTRVYYNDGPGVVFPGFASAAEFDAVAGDDGSVWVFGAPQDGSASDARSVWAIAPDGTTRWIAALGMRNAARLVLDADALYVIQYDGQNAPDREKTITEVTRLDRATGAKRWQFVSEDAHWYSGTGSFKVSPLGGLATSADHRSLLLVHNGTRRLRLQTLDAATGARQGERFIACNDYCGTPAEIALDAAGTARMAIDILDRDAGLAAAVIAVDAAARPAAATRLDQPGIAGAWWSPYANGEGITFDWLPASRTLFGAWFTYSTVGGNEPSELRWYTVQANGIANGTRSLELPILETVGGNFDAGPAVTPRRAGTARIEFHDCTRGTVHYAFDAGVNDGRSGTITLSRLSPATQPCVLADGSSVPAPAAPPSNGFDAKLSGSWFDEATTGQGLQLTVQPGGVFFAPWFTFDPAVAGNDPGRQHWFTLQGNLAEASNGTAELVLVQTLGGRFDAVPTYNANRIGAATLRVLGCDRAELDYRFDDASSAHAFRARNGTLRLSRAGGCAN